jgi:hypothetical protein
MIDVAFILGHSPYYEMAFIKKNFACFLKVCSLSSYATDDAKSIAYVINPSRVINSNFPKVTSILAKELYNLFDVYL